MGVECRSLRKADCPRSTRLAILLYTRSKFKRVFSFGRNDKLGATTMFLSNCRSLNDWEFSYATFRRYSSVLLSFIGPVKSVSALNVLKLPLMNEIDFLGWSSGFLVTRLMVPPGD